MCGNIGNDTAVINRNKTLLYASTTIPQARPTFTSAGTVKKLLRGTRFGELSNSGGLNVENGPEFEINNQKDRVSSILQHFVVSLQKQINWYARLEEPQRCFQGEVYLKHTFHDQIWSVHPSVTWKEKVKSIDTGYETHQADLINERRDELFHRLVEYFKKRRVQLKLLRFTESPPGFCISVKWDEKSDKFALTPEGEPIMVPRVDTFQTMSRTKHFGLGRHQSACQ